MVISDVSEQKKPDRKETSRTIPSHKVPEQTKEVLVGLMEAWRSCTLTELFCIDVCLVTQVCAVAKIHWAGPLKRVHLGMCKLHFNKIDWKTTPVSTVCCGVNWGEVYTELTQGRAWDTFFCCCCSFAHLHTATLGQVGLGKGNDCLAAGLGLTRGWRVEDVGSSAEKFLLLQEGQNTPGEVPSLTYPIPLPLPRFRWSKSIC